jgi:hypothetical protein
MDYAIDPIRINQLQGIRLFLREFLERAESAEAVLQQIRGSQT